MFGKLFAPAYAGDDEAIHSSPSSKFIEHPFLFFMDVIFSIPSFGNRPRPLRSSFSSPVLPYFSPVTDLRLRPSSPRSYPRHFLNFVLYRITCRIVTRSVDSLLLRSTIFRAFLNIFLFEVIHFLKSMFHLLTGMCFSTTNLF